MAEKGRFLDVWIVESNTVYKAVPFAVVTDWLQQGRLLEEDQVRPPGTSQWTPISALPVFGPYLPKSQPYGVEDQAEALEPVQIDFGWKRRRDLEDEDVDMIPLIDISLVLLIFFMMTTVAGAVGTLIQTPYAQNRDLASLAENMVWVGVDFKKTRAGQIEEENGKPAILYSLGKGDKEHVRDIDNQNQLVKEVENLLSQQEDPVKITIRGNREVLGSEITELTAKLQKFQFQKPPKVTEILAEVSEKPQ